jgi:hypothetical protein
MILYCLLDLVVLVVPQDPWSLLGQLSLVIQLGQWVLVVLLGLAVLVVLMIL